MLTTRNIGLLEMEDLYDNFMVKDFPEAERKPCAFLQNLMREGQCRVYVFLNHHKIEGYAVLCMDSATADDPSGSKAMLLDYLAVREDCRGHGMGSWIMRQLPELVYPNGHVMIELEDPAAATDEEEKARRMQRRHFYIKNGAQDTEARTATNGVWFQVFDYAAKETPYTRQEAEDAMKKVYREVLPQSWGDAVIR